MTGTATVNTREIIILDKITTDNDTTETKLETIRFTTVNFTNPIDFRFIIRLYRLFVIYFFYFLQLKHCKFLYLDEAIDAGGSNTKPVPAIVKTSKEEETSAFYTS